MSSNIKLQKTIDQTVRYINNSPLLYVNSGELSYSIGDEVRQFILGPPFAWRWNRSQVAPIVCAAGQSDYTVSLPDFGWIEKAWILYPTVFGTPTQIYSPMSILSISATAGIVTAIVNGNPNSFGFYVGQTISVQQVTDTTFNAFQSLIVTGITANSLTYAQAGTGASSSGGIVFNITSSPNYLTIGNPGAPTKTFELGVNEVLAQESVMGQPAFISVLSDDNNGNITFRLMMTPDTAYTLFIVYQKASPIFGSTQDTWTPIPDYLSYLYNKGVLAKAYEYKGDERFAFAHQEFLRLTVAANDGLTDAQKNLFIAPEIITAREKQGLLLTGQQAKQGRSA